jgi:hypothetical protein
MFLEPSVEGDRASFPLFRVLTGLACRMERLDTPFWRCSCLISEINNECKVQTRPSTGRSKHAHGVCPIIAQTLLEAQTLLAV